MTITPAPQDYGSVQEGTTSSAQTFTVQNTGTSAITLTPLALGGSDAGSFSLANNSCDNATLNPTDSCSVDVSFDPASGTGMRGAKTATLTVGDTAGDDAQVLDLTGTAVAPQIDVPASASFGPVQLGQNSSQIVTVQNDGQGELDVTTPTSPGGDFTVSSTGTTCTGSGAQLDPGDSCNVNVVFTPSATGDENATLVVPSNDPDTPSAQVPLSGTGTQGAVTFNPTGLTFVTHVGTTSPSQTISVQNTGTAPLVIAGPGNGVKINGMNQTSFAITSDGCTSATLQVGDHCDVGISFSTTVLAQRTANLQIKDNGAGGTQLATLSGTGIQSGPLTAAPASNNFGSVVEGSSSAAQTFTFTNTGGDTVTFPGAPGTFSFTGADPGDFTTANDGCSGQTIGAGDTCSVDVTFSPPVGAGVRGARSATLTVTGGFTNSPLSVKLTGTATAPAISVPSSVGFGNVAIGGTPGQQTLTVTNNGAGTLQIGQIGQPSGAGFSMTTDGCSSASLTGGQSCSVVLQFQPTSTGAATGTLQIPHNDPDTTSPVSVSLTGTGTQVGPVTVSPSTLAFGSVVEGSASLSKTVTVTNTGTAPLTGLSLGLSGSGQSNFTILNDNCTGIQVNAGKSCTFKVEFTPVQGAGIRGAQSATITVSGPANASGLPQSVSVSGTATAPTISLPSSYDFGNVPIGQTATHDITVKNTGSGTLDVTGQKVLPAAGFSVQTDGCAAPTGLLAAGESCTITVAFQSTEAGTASGTLSVPNNDPDAAHPAQVSLSATGTVAGPVTISPGSKTFSSQVEGTTSAAQTFTVTNTGTAPVSLGPAPVVSLGGASPGSFTLSGNTCANLTQLGAEKSCVFKVAFSPPVAAGTRGAQNASVTVNGGADLPQTVPLSGTATAPTLSIPGSVNFGSTLVGTPVTQSVTLQNTGTGTLNVAVQSITGAGFSVGTNGCAGASGQLAAGHSCTIKVTFNPTSPGAANGTLKVTDNDPDFGSPASVSLSGTGTQIGPVTLAPGSNNFGSVLEGKTSSPQTFTVTNTGTAQLSVNKVTLGGANTGSFTIQNDNCTGAKVNGGAACTFQVVFSPQVAANVRGVRNATVSVTGNADSMPSPASLTGTATAPQIQVPGNVVDFGDVPVGTTANQNVAVSNQGQGSLVVSAVSTMGTGFSVANNGCAGASLANGQSCTIKVAFKSTATGNATGALQVTSNDPDVSGTTPVTLSANGTQPAVNITGNTAFSTAVGTTSSPQPITVHNTGDAPLKITGVAFNGANPTAFAKPTDGCNGKTVAPGDTCEIDVTFTASDANPKAATLTVTDNAPGSPHTQSLTGTALVPGISITPASEVFSPTQIGVKSPTRTITIKNTGTAALKIGTISLGGTNPANFLKGTGTGDTCTGKSIAVNKSCTVTVNYIPAGSGSHSADVVIPNNSGHTADLPLSGTGMVPPSPTSMTVALGCDSSKISWTEPTGQVQFNGIKILVNPDHAPTSPTDGTSLAHPNGYVMQTGMTHFHTFYYAAYNVYSWYNDSSKLVYAKAVQGSGHTGYICAPRNHGETTDLTPPVNWLSYASGAKYSLLLQQSGKTIQVVFPTGLSYTFPASWSYGGSTHSFAKGQSYFLYLYAYTAAKPDGFLIGQAQFSESP